MLLRVLARFLVPLWFRGVCVRGLGRVPKRGGVLIIANHPCSLVDAFVLAAVLPRRVRISAKRALVARWSLRVALWIIGAVLLVQHDREEDGDGTNLAAMRELLGALRGGAAVVFFPEGVAHSDAELRPFHPGAAWLAVQARVPVLPVRLAYVHKERPGADVAIAIGEPFFATGSREAVTDAMREALEALRDDVVSDPPRRVRWRILLSLPLLPLALVQHAFPAWLAWRKSRPKQPHSAVTAALIHALVVFPLWWLFEIALVASVSPRGAMLFAALIPFSLCAMSWRRVCY
ncbi:MAG TPA: 1-acyl-sn-glycerol-3-phosphate acyltransferase [Thermoanaerobaculia bacterium]|nr:1-acyl-sn-glycerol-3-phosphate acyltransferase [Thermoanaerobaculia bacterium]